jgi:hypothetical protein
MINSEEVEIVLVTGTGGFTALLLSRAVHVVFEHLGIAHLWDAAGHGPQVPERRD